MLVQHQPIEPDADDAEWVADFSGGGCAYNRSRFFEIGGYVPLPTQAYSQAKSKFDARRTGTYFGGASKVGVTVAELLADTAAAPATSS